ncbi:MAG: hypothetical protein P0119_20175 [Nitrospira sp.]|nr:hypothetical protein [Nitrospira sp.]
MKVVEFVILLSQQDRFRHRHVRLAGRVTEFVIQYEVRQGEEWVLVVRYDTAHGFAHRDLFSSKENVVKTPLGMKDLNTALTFAESDLKANWKWYRRRYWEE